MRVSKEQIIELCKKTDISQDKAATLCSALENHRKSRGVSFAHLCYIYGAFFVLCGMFVLFAIGVGLGGTATFGVTLSYVVALLLLGGTLWFRKNESALGGLIVTAAVVLAPLTLVGLAISFSVLPNPAVDPTSIAAWMDFPLPLFELGLIIAATTALYFVRFPLLSLPLLTGIWLGGVHVLNWIFDLSVSLNPLLWWSFALGLALVIFAATIDRKLERDYALWIHAFAAWLLFAELIWFKELHLISSGLFYGGMAGLMLLSLPLNRCIFMVFGTIGIFSYATQAALPWLSQPLGLISLIPAGIALLVVGSLYHRYRDPLEKVLLAIIPARIRKHLPCSR